MLSRFKSAQHQIAQLFDNLFFSHHCLASLHSIHILNYDNWKACVYLSCYRSIIIITFSLLTFMSNVEHVHMFGGKVAQIAANLARMM